MHETGCGKRKRSSCAAQRSRSSAEQRLISRQNVWLSHSVSVSGVCEHSRTHSLCIVRVRRGRATSSGHSDHLHNMTLAHIHRYTGAHSAAVACAPPQHRTSPAFAASSHATSKRKKSGASGRPPIPAHTAPTTPSHLAARERPNGAIGAADATAAATAAARAVSLYLGSNELEMWAAGPASTGGRFSQYGPKACDGIWGVRRGRGNGAWGSGRHLFFCRWIFERMLIVPIRNCIGGGDGQVSGKIM